MIASNSKPRVTPKQLDRYDRERQLALKLALDLGDDRFAREILQDHQAGRSEDGPEARGARNHASCACISCRPRSRTLDPWSL